MIANLLPFDWRLREDLRMTLSHLRYLGKRMEYIDREKNPIPNSSWFSSKKGNRNEQGRPKGSINKPKDLTAIL
jgi:hypothetical protein